MMKLTLNINEDIHLKDYIYKTYSKKFYGYLKSTNAIFYLNNKLININSVLKKNDILTIEYNNKDKKSIKTNKPIFVLYEDEYILIVDKEHNLLTIPNMHEYHDSLYNRLIFHYPNDSINIITRLDKATAGIVVVAKKHYLVEQINITDKIYLAQTINLLELDEGIINLPIAKSDTIKREVNTEGKTCITEYKLIDKDKKIYKLKLHTGRTHQIRVHLSYYNCSIVGDGLYGVSTEGDLKLVCSEIKLIHPISKEVIHIVSKHKLG